MPLHYAAGGGCIEAMRALVTEFKCSPDCRDNVSGVSVTVSDLSSPNDSCASPYIIQYLYEWVICRCLLLVHEVQ